MPVKEMVGKHYLARLVEFMLIRTLVVEKCNIHTAARLDEWLGVNNTADKANNAKYPQCRFMYGLLI